MPDISPFQKGGEPPHNSPGFGPKISKFEPELEAWGHSEKSEKLVFFHCFRFIETSTGLRIAPKSLSLVGTVPTDLPAKEFLKKTNPGPSYGPKRDGGSRPDSRRSSRFPPNFTKNTMARSTVKISAQFKKGVNPHISTKVLGQKYPNLGKNWRPGGAPK